MTGDHVAEALANAAPPAGDKKKSRRKRRVEPEVLETVHEINGDHALVLVGDKTVIVRETEDELGHPKVGFMTPDTFRLWHATRKFYNGHDKPQGIGSIWLEHAERRQYKGVTFAPDGAREGWYNLWRGFSVEGAAVDPDKAFPTFKDHLFTNVAGGNQAYYDWIVGWFAHMVQRPAERLGTAIVLRGKQGTGKSKVGEVMGALVADHYLLVADPRYITGQFNAHLANCMLLHADEGFWAGDRGAVGVINSLITSSVHMIERKGVDPVPIRNLVRLFACTEKSWAVPATLEARRFAVFDVGEAAMQNTAYFREIDREQDNGGREALFHFLSSYDLAKVDLRDVPQTEALTEQKVHSMDAEVAWWRWRLLEGSQIERYTEWVDGDVPIDWIRESYTRWAEKLGRRRVPTEEQLGIALGKLLPPGGLMRTRPTMEMPVEFGTQKRRVRCYRFPGLEICRHQFDKLMRVETKWDAEDG